MQELSSLFCTDLLVGWWSEESVVTWTRINDWEIGRLGERVRGVLYRGTFKPEAQGRWRVVPRTLETFCDRDPGWYSELFSAVGRNYLKNFLYYEWSLIYWYFVCFLSLEGCSWLRKIKRKLTEFLKRSYRNSRFSWYRTILFWAGFVWVGSCTGWVEWELNQQSRVWGSLVWGSSGAGSWELKGLLILFRDFLQIVSGDTVQGYYQTLSYIYNLIFRLLVDNGCSVRSSI